MKYEKEYLLSKDKKSFIKLVMGHYPNIKVTSIDRMWYNLRKKLVVKKEIITVQDKPITTFDEIEFKEPHHSKILLFNDIVKYRKKADDHILRKYGFSNSEINWLKEYYSNDFK